MEDQVNGSAQAPLTEEQVKELFAKQNAALQAAIQAYGAALIHSRRDPRGIVQVDAAQLLVDMKLLDVRMSALLAALGQVGFPMLTFGDNAIQLLQAQTAALNDAPKILRPS